MLVGRILILPHVGTSLELYKKVRIGATAHYFWRASNRDALYNLASSVSRNGLLTTSRNIGPEVDLYVKGYLSRHVSLWAGVSRFWPKQFLQATGTNSASNFYYAQLKYWV